MANSAEIFKEQSDYKNPSGVASAQAPSLRFLTGTVYFVGFSEKTSQGLAELQVFTPHPCASVTPIFIGEYAFLDTRLTGAVHLLSASGGSKGLAVWVPSHTSPRVSNFIHLRQSH